MEWIRFDNDGNSNTNKKNTTPRYLDEFLGIRPKAVIIGSYRVHPLGTFAA